MRQFKIQPVAVNGFADADGVLVNESGSWVGEITLETPDGPEVVAVYADEDGDYIPAPANWESLIIESLQ